MYVYVCIASVYMCYECIASVCMCYECKGLCMKCTFVQYNYIEIYIVFYFYFFYCTYLFNYYIKVYLFTYINTNYNNSIFLMYITYIPQVVQCPESLSVSYLKSRTLKRRTTQRHPLTLGNH